MEKGTRCVFWSLFPHRMGRPRADCRGGTSPEISHVACDLAWGDHRCDVERGRCDCSGLASSTPSPASSFADRGVGFLLSYGHSCGCAVAQRLSTLQPDTYL